MSSPKDVAALIGGGIGALALIRGYLALSSSPVGGVVDGVKDQVIDSVKGFIGIGGSSSGGVGGKVPENDSKCKTKGVTDKGIIDAAKWKAILNGTILVANTWNALRMAKLQRDLARDYKNLAETHRRYYRENFQDIEKRLTTEALALPKYIRDKERLNTGQMLISARVSSAGKADRDISCTSRYCTGQRAAIISDQLLQQATIESMVAGMAHRYTDKEEIIHNNLRWEKREQVMKVGRDIPAQSVSYASLAGGIFGSLGEQAGKAAEGAMSFLGYDRRNTEYPERRSDMTVSTYKYSPTALRDAKFARHDTYKKVEEPTQKIKVMG